MTSPGMTSVSIWASVRSDITHAKVIIIPVSKNRGLIRLPSSQLVHVHRQNMYQCRQDHHEEDGQMQHVPDGEKPFVNGEFGDARHQVCIVTNEARCRPFQALLIACHNLEPDGG